MSRIVIVKGKKFRVPVIVAKEGPFILVRRLTIPPKPLGIEFVVKRRTDLGNVLISSILAAKTFSEGRLRMRLVAKAERTANALGDAAVKAGVGFGKIVFAGGKAVFSELVTKKRRRKKGKK